MGGTLCRDLQGTIAPERPGRRGGSQKTKVLSIEVLEHTDIHYAAHQDVPVGAFGSLDAWEGRAASPRPGGSGPPVSPPEVSGSPGDPPRQSAEDDLAHALRQQPRATGSPSAGMSQKRPLMKAGPLAVPATAPSASSSPRFNDLDAGVDLAAASGALESATLVLANLDLAAGLYLDSSATSFEARSDVGSAKAVVRKLEALGGDAQHLNDSGGFGAETPRLDDNSEAPTAQEPQDAQAAPFADVVVF